MRDKANPIQLKGCPICKTTIRKCLRYGNLINQILEDIERVKGQMIGDTGIIDRVSHQILRNPIISGNVVDRHRLGNVRIPAVRSMKEKISNAYSERIQSAFEARLKILMNGNFYTETQLLSLENQHRLVKAAVDIRYRFKTNIEKTTVDERHVMKQNLIVLSSTFLKRLSSEVGVLTEDEIDDFTREIQRGNTYLSFRKMKSAITSVGKDKEGADDLLKIEQLITDKGRFTEETEKEIADLLTRLKELLKIEGLGITEVERLQIIKAVGLSKGHWFKCPKSK
jgi:hypothetical protein